jgi:hypothetical protein
MQAGERIRPEEIGLYVAVDGDVEPSLSLIVSTLRSHHRLNIGVIQVARDSMALPTLTGKANIGKVCYHWRSNITEESQ